MLPISVCLVIVVGVARCSRVDAEIDHRQEMRELVQNISAGALADDHIAAVDGVGRAGE